LDEIDEELQVYALDQLNQVVPVFWAEIADALPKMYVLFFLFLRLWFGWA